MVSKALPLGSEFSLSEGASIFCARWKVEFDHDSIGVAQKHLTQTKIGNGPFFKWNLPRQQPFTPRFQIL